MGLVEILRGETPFSRLARTHCFSIAGDALLTIALADSIFFDVDPNQAHWRVALYLLLTIAPFAVVAPFLGPLMDRIKGGHRYMVIGSAAIRAALMVILVRYVSTFGLYPLAFSMLVMGKTYSIAKSSLVPTTVASEEALIRSNSTLAIASAVSGGAAGLPGVIALRFGGAPWVLALGAGMFVIAVILGFGIPATTVAREKAALEEKQEMKSSNIRLAVGAMSFLRCAVGFVTILLAFELRGGVDPGPTGAAVELGHSVRASFGMLPLDLTSGGAPPWHFGVALVGAGIGGLIGSAVSPRLRAFVVEERILAFGLILLAGGAAIAVVVGGLIAVFVVSAAVGLAAQGGNQAFDAIIQRDARQANLGRVFGRLESRFQLLWVIGALVPALIPLPARVGFFLLAIAGTVVAAMYWLGRTFAVPRSLLSVRSNSQPDKEPVR